MQIVEPSVKLLWITLDPLRVIEMCGRTCYKSEDKITADSSERFVRMLLDNGHESVIEHASMSYRVVCDRGVSHEIVRHRLFSYSQEGTGELETVFLNGNIVKEQNYLDIRARVNA